MQHEVTNGRDPICNMKLPMVGTLYVTRDPICNGTLPTLLKYIDGINAVFDDEQLCEHFKLYQCNSFSTTKFEF